MEDEEQYRKVLRQKVRVRKQQKRRISENAGTLSRQAVRGKMQASKTTKTKVKINLKKS